MFSKPRDIWDHLRSDIVYETYSDTKLAGLYLENVDGFPVHIFSKVLDVLLDPLFKLEDHLRSDIVYETYSDMKLAKLYLENVDDFPVHIFSKVLDLLLDPLFELEDITFKSAGDVFEHISAYRREKFPSPNPDRQIPSRSTSEGLVSQPSLIPTDLVSLVVDKMVENRTPLGEASMEEVWKRAYSNDVEDFHAMSLVYPSWTPIVRRGLRRRAIVPYHRLDRFLVSPLCGPWVTEVIIYWTVDNGPRGTTFSDVYLFEALLRRIPNVHSLAFNTSLVWLRYRFPLGMRKKTPLRVVSCLELVTRLLPSLENLQLNHFSVSPPSYVDSDYEGDDAPLSESLYSCRGLRSLFALLPRMQSLKRLSLYGWTDYERGAKVDLNEHPSPNLRTLELTDKVWLSSRSLNWLIKPRNGFNLRGLSVSIRQLELMGYRLPNLQELRLYLSGKSSEMFFPGTLEKYEQLVRLNLFVSADFDLGGAVLPKKLEQIAFCMSDVDLHCLLSHGPARPSTSWRFSSNLVPLMKEQLSHLKCLRSLHLVGVPSVEDMWRSGQNPAVGCVRERKLPRELLDLCEEHGISLVCGKKS